MIALLLLAGSSYALGTVALFGVGWSDLRAYERVALRLAAGLGLTALLLSFLALAGWFSLARFVLGALTLATLVAVASALPSKLRAGGRFTVGTKVRLKPDTTRILVAVAAALACAGAIAPITDDDALDYVLPIARHIAATGRLQVWPDQAHSLFPQSQQVLLAWVLGMGGGGHLGIVTALEWLLCLAVVGALARRATGRTECVAPAMALALGAPVVAFLVTSGKEDLLLVAMTTASAVCVCGSGTRRELVAAAMFAGLAAGAKYSGLGVAMAVVAWMAFSKREQRWQSVAIALVTVAAAGGLWYALNFWRYGNPVAPLIFGARGTPYDTAVASLYNNNFGAGRSHLAFVLAPFRIFYDSSSFGGRANLFNPLVYAGVAALVWPDVRRRHAPLLFIAAVLYVGWFFNLQNARLLLPAAVLLAPAAAECLLVPMLKARWPRRAAAWSAVALSVGIVAIVGTVRAVRYVEDPATFLERETQHYADMRWMNEHLNPETDRVASEFKVLGYLRVPSLVLDPTRQLEISAAELAHPDLMLFAARRQGITHLFGTAGSFATLRAHLRVVHANPASRLGGVRFFRDAPSEPTAVFEILD